ncbi:MAG: hypothetical protein JNM55_03200 [Anaerolineales bacterium]|nr:hypothetical protein [Anaerolineales bacterium]
MLQKGQSRSGPAFLIPRLVRIRKNNPVLILYWSCTNLVVSEGKRVDLAADNYNQTIFILEI